MQHSAFDLLFGIFLFKKLDRDWNWLFRGINASVSIDSKKCLAANVSKHFVDSFEQGIESIEYLTPNFKLAFSNAITDQNLNCHQKKNVVWDSKGQLLWKHQCKKSLRLEKSKLGSSLSLWKNQDLLSKWNEKRILAIFLQIQYKCYRINSTFLHFFAHICLIRSYRWCQKRIRSFRPNFKVTIIRCFWISKQRHRWLTDASQNFSASLLRIEGYAKTDKKHSYLEFNYHQLTKVLANILTGEPLKRRRQKA